MKRTLQSGIVVLFLCFLLIPLQTIQAIRGVPGSPEFGYGSWLYPEGGLLLESTQLINELPLDWIAIPLDWGRVMPEMSSAPDIAALDQVMDKLKSTQAVVMFRLVNPPHWAMTETGVNADLTAQWLAWLAQRYQPLLRAVELFPAANTQQGWGRNPDPLEYAMFFQGVQAGLRSRGVDLLLIAAGLQPLNPNSGSQDWDDLTFLQALYQQGAKDWMPVLSIQLPLLSGDATRPPDNGDQFALRHYERVRQTMLANNHQDGVLWVTTLLPPDGKIDSADQKYSQSIQQAEWLKQALIQMRSQLYMGVVFSGSLNPPPAAQPNQVSLMTAGNTVHPFYSVLEALIHQTNPSSPDARPGRPKTIPIPKCQHKK